MTVEVLLDAATLAATVAERLGERLASVQAEGRRPSLVLTGGTIASEVYERLDAAGPVDWTDVDYYWGDERFVPEGHDDRNDRQAHETFLDRLSVPAERVHAMPAHGCGIAMAASAHGYADGLPDEPFDVVLLGVGPDGHIASLFPGFPQLQETERHAIEVFDSPKPPAERITLTLPALNHAEAVWFVASGSGKADAVARALAPTGSVEQTPARGVGGRRETVWLIDQDAAGSSG